MTPTIASNACAVAAPAPYAAAPAPYAPSAVGGGQTAVTQVSPAMVAQVSPMCAVSCCPVGGAVQQGAAGAPSFVPAIEQAAQGAAATTAPVAPAAAPAPAPAVAPAPAPASVGTVDPSSVTDRTSANGLSAASLRGLEEAHRFGLPLVSGYRSGGSRRSDHATGNAIDVGTLAIGSAGSTRGTEQMRAFAEHMRQAGMRGELGVKYVIRDGEIASARENWAWRPYTYPGKSTAQLEALKQSNRGEYNRIQHYDHVHVSFR